MDGITWYILVKNAFGEAERVDIDGFPGGFPSPLTAITYYYEHLYHIEIMGIISNEVKLEQPGF